MGELGVGEGGTAGAASQCGCEVPKPREAQKDFLYILLYMEYVCPGSVLVAICAIYVTELATCMSHAWLASESKWLYT